MALVRVESYVSPGVFQPLWINPDAVKVVAEAVALGSSEPLAFVGFKEAIELPLPPNLLPAEPYIRSYTTATITVKGNAGEVALALSQTR